MLDFPSLLYKGLRILMFQLSGVYCIWDIPWAAGMDNRTGTEAKRSREYDGCRRLHLQVCQDIHREREREKP